MKASFWIGMAVLILGFVSLVAPISRSKRSEIKAGGVSLGVEARQAETLPLFASVAMILGGAGTMVAGKRKG